MWEGGLPCGSEAGRGMIAGLARAYKMKAGNTPSASQKTLWVNIKIGHTVQVKPGKERQVWLPASMNMVAFVVG